jgi:SPP1 gp7 family putative phage head morphogenesis protein
MGKGMRYLTGKNKRREVALQGALLDRLSARFQMSVARQIQNAMRAGLKQFEQDGSTVSVDAAIDPYEIRMTATISTEARNIMQTFGERILGNEKRLRKDIGDDPFEQVMQNYIKTYGLQHAKQITTTTKDQLRTLIQDALNEGIGTEQIARNIRKKIPSMAQYRAATIARTETHTAANFGSQAAAEATGLVLMKEWAAAEDDRTREDHAAADGQVVPMNGSFTVGGVELQFPGDPSGPPEQVINCRCVQLFIET